MSQAKEKIDHTALPRTGGANLPLGSLFSPLGWVEEGLSSKPWMSLGQNTYVDLTPLSPAKPINESREMKTESG